MNVDVKGLIKQLQNLRERLIELRDKIDEMNELGEEAIDICAIEDLLVWSDALNLEIACDGLKQAYLEK